jgi:hypothetical protein
VEIFVDGARIIRERIATWNIPGQIMIYKSGTGTGTVRIKNLKLYRKDYADYLPTLTEEEMFGEHVNENYSTKSPFGGNGSNHPASLGLCDTYVKSIKEMMQDISVKDCSVGVVYKNTGTAQTTAVTTQEDLMSYTIPGGTLKPGKRVRIKAYGTLGANTNGKTVRIYFGSSSIGGIATPNANGTDWSVDAEVEILGITSQEYIKNGMINGVTPQIGRGTVTENINNSIIAKVQGQNSTASAGDIVCQHFSVEIIP